MNHTKKYQHKYNNILYIKGNLFDYANTYIHNDSKGCSVVVPHVCNNVGAFNSGFVQSINQKYPIVKENYLLLDKSFLKKNLGYTQYVTVESNKKYDHKMIIANMIAQNGTISKSNSRPLNYYALVKCMSSIRQLMYQLNKDNNAPQIHCPKFGSGLAGGDWSFIENLIEDIWHDFTVFVYHI